MRRSIAPLSALLALALASCSSTPARPIRPTSGDPLDADWLDGESSISVDHLKRALAVGKGDVEVQALVQQATKRIGGGSFEGLAARFSPCRNDLGLEGGLTEVKSQHAYVAKSLDELAFGRRADKTTQELASVQRAPARDSEVVDGPDYLFVKRNLMPEICIVPRLALIEAYAAIVHELVHALSTDPRELNRLAGAPQDAHTYDIATLLQPGSEVDAYTVSTRARFRVVYSGQRVSPILGLFDAKTGALRASRAQLAEVILAPTPNGLGYGDTILKDALPNARAKLLEEASSKRDFLGRMRDERRANLAVFKANIDVHTHNLEVHRQNLDIANQRGDAALAQRSRAGMDEAKRLRDEATKLVDTARASEARLTAEIATADAQVASLRSL